VLGNGHLYAQQLHLTQGISLDNQIKSKFAWHWSCIWVSHKFVEFFRRQDGRFFRIMPSFLMRVVKIVYKIQAV